MFVHCMCDNGSGAVIKEQCWPRHHQEALPMKLKLSFSLSLSLALARSLPSLLPLSLPSLFSPSRPVPTSKKQRTERRTI